MALVEFGRKLMQSYPIPSLYLYGVWGSGKTTFAFALIRELMRWMPIQNYFWPNYMFSRDLDNALLRAVKSDDGDTYEIEKWIESDLLFIDDVDKVTATERFKMQLFDIVNKRMMKSRPTIITSNARPNDLSQIIDGALVSRMADDSKWKLIQFPNRDLRKTKVMTFE